MFGLHFCIVVPTMLIVACTIAAACSEFLPLVWFIGLFGTCALAYVLNLERFNHDLTEGMMCLHLLVASCCLYNGSWYSSAFFVLLFLDDLYNQGSMDIRYVKCAFLVLLMHFTCVTYGDSVKEKVFQGVDVEVLKWIDVVKQLNHVSDDCVAKGYCTERFYSTYMLNITDVELKKYFDSFPVQNKTVNNIDIIFPSINLGIGSSNVAAKELALDLLRNNSQVPAFTMQYSQFTNESWKFVKVQYQQSHFHFKTLTCKPPVADTHNASTRTLASDITLQCMAEEKVLEVLSGWEYVVMGMMTGIVSLTAAWYRLPM